MIGINPWKHEPQELKEVMKKENLGWRSFADDGTISRTWNSPATPTFYVLDHKGVIRHKWIGHPGEQAIDVALEKLIQQADKPDRN